MRKMESISLLRKILDGTDFVIRPDHPFLMVGPDVLFYESGILAGIFVFSELERRAPDLLAERMAMSRLAYPDEFVTVLVHPTREEYPESNVSLEVLSRHFDAIVPESKLRDLVGYLQDFDAGASKVIVPSEIRYKAYKYAEILLSNSLEFASSDDHGNPFGLSDSLPDIAFKSSLDLRPWSKLFADPNKFGRRYYNRLEVFKMRNFTIMCSSLPENRRASILSRFGQAVFATSYQLDSGVPYPQKPAFNILLAPSIPFHRSDPWKWVRAASFAGFGILTPAKPEIIQQRLEEIERSMAS